MAVLVEGANVGRCQQFPGGREIACGVFGFGCNQRTSGPSTRVGGQRHRPLPKRGGRGHPAAPLGAIGRPDELGGHFLIGRARRVGAMPGPPVRVTVRVGCFGQRGMRRPPLVGVGGQICRRARRRIQTAPQHRYSAAGCRSVWLA